jgi:NitT/TauT family transport system substrate-binding protein
MRAPRPFVLASVARPVQRRGSGGHDQYRQRIAGRDCARRGRHSDFALVDINELIRFRDKADAPPVKAVFVLFNKAPYAIIARKSRGIHALSDIEGKTLGVAEGDLSIRLWPALARQNGIKLAA